MRSTTVLDVWVADLTFPGYMDWWARMARAFEERHPEYDVEIRALPFFTGPQELSAAIAAGHGPAVGEYYFYLSQAARDAVRPDGSPYYTSVRQAVDGRAEILGEPVVLDDIVPALRDYYTFHGDLVAMPSVGTTSVIYANTDLLEAAGLSSMPSTWAEVDQACTAVAALTDGPGHAITWSNHGMFFQQALAVQGGRLTDHRNGRDGRATRIDLASPEMLAWAGWWQRLHGAGHYRYTGKIPDWQGTFEAFAAREVAMRISSTNDVSYMVQAAKAAGFGIEVAPFPHNGDRPYAGNAIAGSALWLADRLDEQTRDGALAFLQFVHNPENAANRHQENSFLPLTNAAVALLEDEGWFAQHPYHRVGTDLLAGRPSEGAVFGEFARVQDIMTHAVGDVLVGRAELADRMSKATEDAQVLLDAYNADPGHPDPDALRVEFFTDAEVYSGADLENVVALKR